MIQLTLTQTTPLIQEADGTVRITGSRVTLDTIIGAFRKGARAEQIHRVDVSYERWHFGNEAD
jgi:uncharacterized protein (DUF433 family)